MTNASEIGKSGEDQAEEFLKKIGYKILERNFRTRYGEIDIIAKENGTYVFVEVKTRKLKDGFGEPQFAVNKHKQHHLALAAFTYIKKESLHSDYRFDIVAICRGKIEHIENAFSPEGYTV